MPLFRNNPWLSNNTPKVLCNTPKVIFISPGVIFVTPEVLSKPAIFLNTKKNKRKIWLIRKNFVPLHPQSVNLHT